MRAVIGVVQYCEVLLGRGVTSVWADTRAVASVRSVRFVDVDISMNAEIFVFAYWSASLGGCYLQTTSVGGSRGVGLYVGINLLSRGAGHISLRSVIVELSKMLTCDDTRVLKMRAVTAIWYTRCASCSAWTWTNYAAFTTRIFFKRSYKIESIFTYIRLETDTVS